MPDISEEDWAVRNLQRQLDRAADQLRKLADEVEAEKAGVIRTRDRARGYSSYARRVASVHKHVLATVANLPFDVAADHASDADDARVRSIAAAEAVATPKNPAKIVVVMYLDQGGKPRAYATGPAEELSAVNAIASDQLDAYLSEHGGTRADYTLRVEEL